MRRGALTGEITLSNEGEVAIITLNKPATLNAFDQPMAQELANRVGEVAGDPRIRVLLLRGAGKHFCAGGDLHAISGAHDPSAYVLKLARTANGVLEGFRRMDKPVIAELKGAVAGGGVGVALAADLRIADETAKISLAFLKVGLSPDMGATWTLPRLVGRGKAFELAAVHDPLPVQEALRLGLVNRVVKAGELEKEGSKWAQELAKLPPRAVSEVKALFNDGEGRSFEEHLKHDSGAIARAAGTADFKEGVQAFVEKRPPKFKGH